MRFGQHRKMTRDEGPAFDTLKALMAGREDLVSRLAAPLWARVGRPLNSDLLWVRSLLGEKGPEILIQTLHGFDALDQDGILRARGLAHFVSSIVGETEPVSTAVSNRPELVWTLPNSHPAHSVRGRSYLESCIRLINDATRALTLVSPFVDPSGIGTLLLPLTAALSRGVEVILFVHDALNLGSLTSRALEELRREADRRMTDLSVYSAEAGTGGDRLLNPLFHAKLVVCDNRRLLLGSANLTAPAFGSNFEAGVLLGDGAATEALFILEGILRAKTVYLVFHTKAQT